MTLETPFPNSPRMAGAHGKPKGSISDRYPQAIFDVGEGEDPDGVDVTATVDAEDMGEVVDLFLNRLVGLQVEDARPLFVVAVRPLECTLDLLAAGGSQPPRRRRGP